MNIEQEVKNQKELLEKIYKSVEKTRKYFLWTLILSLVFFIGPLLGLALILPSVINTITGASLGL